VTGKTASRLREWAERLKSEVIALWFCARHPRTPFVAKVLAAVLVAYALSPIDLIPDFIPFAGWLDDLVIVPLLVNWIFGMLSRAAPPQDDGGRTVDGTARRL